MALKAERRSRHFTRWPSVEVPGGTCTGLPESEGARTKSFRAEALLLLPKRLKRVKRGTLSQCIDPALACVVDEVSVCRAWFLLLDLGHDHGLTKQTPNNPPEGGLIAAIHLCIRPTRRSPLAGVFRCALASRRLLSRFRILARLGETGQTLGSRHRNDQYPAARRRRWPSSRGLRCFALEASLGP